MRRRVSLLYLQCTSASDSGFPAVLAWGTAMTGLGLDSSGGPDRGCPGPRPRRTRLRNPGWAVAGHGGPVTERTVDGLTWRRVKR